MKCSSKLRGDKAILHQDTVISYSTGSPTPDISPLSELGCDNSSRNRRSVGNKTLLRRPTESPHVNGRTCLWIIYARAELKEKNHIELWQLARKDGCWVECFCGERLMHLGARREGPFTHGKGANTGIVVWVMAVINLTLATRADASRTSSWLAVTLDTWAGSGF